MAPGFWLQITYIYIHHVKTWWIGIAIQNIELQRIFNAFKVDHSLSFCFSFQYFRESHQKLQLQFCWVRKSVFISIRSRFAAHFRFYRRNFEMCVIECNEFHYVCIQSCIYCILSSPAMRALNSTTKSCVHHIYALCLKSHELGARCGLS